MQQLFNSMALIRRCEDATTRWLGIWDRANSWWDFVIARRLNKETFRESVTREVAWRLDLDRNRDFLVSNMAQLNMEYIGTLPGEFNEMHIAVAFYAVDIYRKHAFLELSKRKDIRWLNSAEVCQGASVDGYSINPLVPHWINKWQVILPWEP